jgi:hypothetical protein
MLSISSFTCSSADFEESLIEFARNAEYIAADTLVPLYTLPAMTMFVPGTHTDLTDRLENLAGCLLLFNEDTTIRDGLEAGEKSSAESDEFPAATTTLHFSDSWPKI